MTNQTTINNIVSGVQNTQKNPMALATDSTNSAKWKNKMQAENTFQKWVANTQAFSLDNWKTRTAKADAAKMAAAANGAETKFTDVFTTLLAFEYALAAYLDQQMPGTDDVQRVMKSAAFQFGMEAFLKNGKATIQDAVAVINAKMGGITTLQG